MLQVSAGDQWAGHAAGTIGKPCLERLQTNKDCLLWIDNQRSRGRGMGSTGTLAVHTVVNQVAAKGP